MPATLETPIAKDTNKSGDTTIRLKFPTRERLDELKDDLFPGLNPSYDDVLRALMDRAERAGEIDEDVAASLLERIQALEEVVHMISADPANGYLFLADRVERGVDGEARKAEHMFDEAKLGAFVKAPSGKTLSELHNTIPPKVLEMVKREERKRQAAAELLAKKKTEGRV